MALLGIEFLDAFGDFFVCGLFSKFLATHDVFFRDTPAQRVRVCCTQLIQKIYLKPVASGSLH